MTPAFLTNIPPMGYLIIALVVLVLFGRGKISAMMGEMGKGITAFKKGVSDNQTEIEDAASEVAKDVTPEDKKDKS
ncbi:MAG: twin-arginine translocase TatA/TatE family subunit [Rhodobacterales bacterium]|jgi:sec-independent protein translocase protein TatA